MFLRAEFRPVHMLMNTGLQICLNPKMKVQRAMACNRWIHKYWVRMLTAEYEQLAETSLSWYCPDCGTANHSSVLYDIPILDNSISVIQV